MRLFIFSLNIPFNFKNSFMGLKVGSFEQSLMECGLQDKIEKDY